MSSLTKQQKTTLVYIVGFALSLAIGGALLYSLPGSRKTLAKLQQEVELKEQQARGARGPNIEEQDKWSQQRDQINNLLLPDQAESQFMEEITRVASESGIQRLGMNTDANSLDGSKTPESAELLAAGVHRYLRVTMHFEGQYAEVARFLGGVAKLQRPVEFRLIDMKRALPMIEVQLVMNVYKRGPA